MFHLAKQIFYAAINAVDPFNCVKNATQGEGDFFSICCDSNPISYNLNNFKTIKVVGCGKAVWPMARAIENVVEDKISTGYCVTKYGHVSTPYPSKITIVEAGHPYPDVNGNQASAKTVQILKSATENDLVIALISGGGSSLWAYPVPQISLDELNGISKSLIGCGATIEEINTVRKHLSSVSGGFAALHTHPSSVLAIVVSDVIGDKLDTIASGPFFADSTTFADAQEVLKRYSLYESAAPSIRTYIEDGISGERPETPKPGHECFKNVNHCVVASNRLAIAAAKKHAESLGFTTIVIEEPTCGDVRIAAKNFSRIIKDTKKNHSGKTCIIAGGETTVDLGVVSGKGGRNQEFALTAALEIASVPDVTILSCGTDGTDGPTDAAGAVVDGDTVNYCITAGINPLSTLEQHNSYVLFEKIGNLIKTGPTFTNVMDLQIALIQ